MTSKATYKQTQSVISIFCCGLNEIFAVPGCYAVFTGSYLRKFRANLQIPSQGPSSSVLALLGHCNMALCRLVSKYWLQVDTLVSQQIRMFEFTRLQKGKKSRPPSLIIQIHTNILHYNSFDANNSSTAAWIFSYSGTAHQLMVFHVRNCSKTMKFLHVSNVTTLSADSTLHWFV